MRVVVTGAAGFLGQQLVRTLLQEPRVTDLIASDRIDCGLSHPKLTNLTCSLQDSALLRAVADAQVVIHLAATLGGAAEADPTAAHQINVDASLNLMAACQDRARFVFASSLAVLGETADERAPYMVYGAHKAMVEIAVETATRRGTLDGISLRPGGIVARRDDNPALKSNFLSRVFWAVADGQNLVLPVTEDARTWLASVQNVAGHFAKAALTPELGPARSITLPMTNCRFGDLVAALRQAFPDSPSKITFAPETEIMTLFGQARPLAFEQGLQAGFLPDADLATLVAAATQNGDLP